MTHPVLIEVARRIQYRSNRSRDQYLNKISQMHHNKPSRDRLSCTNLAHGYAAAAVNEKVFLRQTTQAANLAIVTAYNDMLSAHQPYHYFPELIKKAAMEIGCTAQVAGGVPAMCDGVTQGQYGMELSLFSRDIIAQATAIALSHQMFDGILCLGICDKIVPGLLIGSLSYGHLPVMFIPSGPMPSGISNEEKGQARQRYAKGEIDASTLLQTEEASYHSPGTCTFYGTANTNQMLLEIMGLQLPGSAFVPPYSRLRDALTSEAVKRLAEHAGHFKLENGAGYIISAETLVNALAGLAATGGSTNHTIHLVAIARAAGFLLNWDDFAEISQVVPLIASVYPNGKGDINQFHHAGGTAFIIDQLLNHGLLFNDVRTVIGAGLDSYRNAPALLDDASEDTDLGWIRPDSLNLPADCLGAHADVIRRVEQPFRPEGGIQVLQGNLGRAVIKTSAIPEQVKPPLIAPAKIFSSQHAIISAFEAGELNQDVIVVLQGQGPAANGMPELHKVTPALTTLQEQGHRVALLTDGRMSGASGKFPAAIHVTPEALRGGMLGKLKEGDLVELDWQQGTLNYLGNDDLAERQPYQPQQNTQDLGRELFWAARQHVTDAERGASFLFQDDGL